MDPKIVEVFCQVFGLSPAEVHEGLNQESFQPWDSVAHLTLIMSLEQAYDIEFEPDQIRSLTSVPALSSALARPRPQ